MRAPYPTYQQLTDRLEQAETKLASLAVGTDHPLFEHVAMLREDLQHVLNILQGAGGEDS